MLLPKFLAQAFISSIFIFVPASLIKIRFSVAESCFRVVGYFARCLWNNVHIRAQLTNLLYLSILVRVLPELTGRARKTMRRRAFTRQQSSKGSNKEEEQLGGGAARRRSSLEEEQLEGGAARRCTRRRRRSSRRTRRRRRSPLPGFQRGAGNVRRGRWVSKKDKCFPSNSSYESEKLVRRRREGG